MEENIQGWINLYKPKNISSFFAIKKIRSKFKIKKIGHGGTLDPMAEGILPVAIGKATKLIPFINRNEKKYIFIIKWGEQTTTDDAQGEVIESSELIPNKKQIIGKLSEFQGIISQTPPLMSANKIKGRPAYKLFREKKFYKLHSKEVYIKKLKFLESISNNFSKFEIECGKGFYVRSLARDLANSLGTYGHITFLKRTKVGLFSINNSILLDDLLKISQTLSEFNCFHSSVSMLDDILAYEIESEEELANLSLGRPIYINLNKLDLPRLNLIDKNFLFLSNNEKIVSYGKLDGNLFKPKKVLI